MFEKITAFIRFWKYNTHPARMEFKARKTVLFGLKKAFELFKDKKFRTFINFYNQSEEEQNRIFNELVVTNVILLMLLLEQIKRELTAEDHRDYVKALRQAAPSYFKDFIRRINIPEKYAGIWDKLVDLRYKEYDQETLEVRQAFFKEGGELAELAMHKNVMIFQAIAVGLYSHLMRGKIHPTDPLYRYLQPYLVSVHKGYLKKI
ncbi:MAG: hypothetical protein HY454_00955 [Parcubacteria group bacterium]|nr:hypothetical protein [Parcubacteria group bacterium]